jgi:hypothetical protein
MDPELPDMYILYFDQIHPSITLSFLLLSPQKDHFYILKIFKISGEGGEV